jgi:hypothetical protein
MVDVQALLSPDGGTGQDDRPNDSAVALSAYVLQDFGLMHKFVYKPIMQGMSGRSRWSAYARENLKPRMAAQKFWGGKAPGPGAVRRSQREAVTGVLRQEFRRDVLRGLTPRRRAMGKALGKFGRSVGRLSLAAFAADVFEWGVEGMTPGVSKVAARRDQEAIAMENPFDSPGSYTMRQRAVMAIHDSLMNVRQVIGNEASFMHR